jgi:hypothetical protein
MLKVDEIVEIKFFFAETSNIAIDFLIPIDVLLMLFKIFFQDLD